MIIWSLSYVCIAPAVRIITTVYTPSLCVLLVPSYIGRAGNEICQWQKQKSSSPAQAAPTTQLIHSLDVHPVRPPPDNPALLLLPETTFAGKHTQS